MGYWTLFKSSFSRRSAKPGSGVVTVPNLKAWPARGSFPALFAISAIWQIGHLQNPQNGQKLSLLGQIRSIFRKSGRRSPSCPKTKSVSTSFHELFIKALCRSKCKPLIRLLLRANQYISPFVALDLWSSADSVDSADKYLPNLPGTDALGSKNPPTMGAFPAPGMAPPLDLPGSCQDHPKIGVRNSNAAKSTKVLVDELISSYHRLPPKTRYAKARIGSAPW